MLIGILLLLIIQLIWIERIVTMSLKYIQTVSSAIGTTTLISQIVIWVSGVGFLVSYSLDNKWMMYFVGSVVYFVASFPVVVLLDHHTKLQVYQDKRAVSVTRSNT